MTAVVQILTVGQTNTTHIDIVYCSLFNLADDAEAFGKDVWFIGVVTAVITHQPMPRNGASGPLGFSIGVSFSGKCVAAGAAETMCTVAQIDITSLNRLVDMGKQVGSILGFFCKDIESAGKQGDNESQGQ